MFVAAIPKYRTRCLYLNKRIVLAWSRNGVDNGSGLLTDAANRKSSQRLCRLCVAREFLCSSVIRINTHPKDCTACSHRDSCLIEILVREKEDLSSTELCSVAVVRSSASLC